RAIGRAAARAAAATATPLLAYPIWAPYWLTPDDVRRHGSVLVTAPSSTRADSARAAAVGCHRSQLVARPPAGSPVVPEELLRRHGQQLLVGEADDG
ncbi:MAG: hypothetical protein GXX86_14810, partial [Propionibacterium sp.]|nr:hypothetical protein [Propionibacterium sp.]